MKERFILPIITVCILASCISRTDSMTALILDDVQTYMDEQPDSIIAPAARYYENHGSAEEKMKTLYLTAMHSYSRQG